MSDHLVRCSGIVKTFTTSVESIGVLRGLDFTADRGESVAIMGSSGSGKSTFLSILGGIDRADSGDVRVGNWDLGTMNERRMSRYRANMVGFVFQFHYLLKDLTALENVALPAMMAGESRRSAYEKGAALLESFGLGGRKTHYPSQLSGGERQRTAIARALVNEPPVLLADEPTGNLDAASLGGVRDILFELPGKRGTTLVLVTHDDEVASNADRILRLHGGRLERR